MKLSYLTATFLAIFSVLAYNNTAVTYPDGPPNNRCGLYGTQPTCTLVAMPQTQALPIPLP
ncbi:MAG: hypothetical protein IPN94_26550 [Sphingobacteriales bacterium]|nr:hypothetical protein [Sphingobacteriales bacterium]